MSTTTWKRDSEPDISSEQLTTLVRRLYQARGLNDKTLLCYPESGSPQAVSRRFPLYIESEDWLATKDRPLIIKEPLETYRIPSFPENAEYIEWKSARQRVQNSPIYRLVKIQKRSKSGIQLMFDKGSYGQYLSSCEILLDELITQLGQEPALTQRLLREGEWRPGKDDIERLWRKLELRNKLAPDAAALEDLTRRGVKLGIVAATVYKRDAGEGWNALISKRSDNVAEYPGYYGTMPAGTFQPSKFTEWPACYDPGQDKEFDLRYTFLREYLEEVFGLTDETPSADNSPERFFDRTEVKDLLLGIAHGTIRFAWTGIAVALETGKTELTCLLAIDDATYIRKYHDRFLGSWETAEIIEIPYDEFGIGPYLLERRVSPANAMALIQGLRVLASDWFTPDSCPPF
jgi:hypothetical protein